MNAAIEKAVAVLQRGGLVAFPTETVYGLGADARNPAALRKIFAAKGRPVEHPLIVHLPAAAELADWAQEVPEDAEKLALAFWPGPLTLILKRSAGVPDEVTGGQETVGLRVPGHPLALDLLRAFGGGLAAPSANRFGRISPTRAEHVVAELEGRVDLVLDGGPCEVGLESTIVDLSRGAAVILRPGRVSAEAVAEVLGYTPHTSAASSDRQPRVSGALPSHYAPETASCLVADLEDALRRHKGRRIGLLAHSGLRAEAHAAISLPPEPGHYAQHLYDALRKLDAADCEVILIETVPQTPEWSAIQDRLQRAAAREKKAVQP